MNRGKRFLLFACVCRALAVTFPAGAAAPPGRYTVSNGTVYDGRTKLTWQQTVDAGTYTQTAAATYCQNLQLAGTGWRLPKVSELVSIVDRTETIPAVDPTAFPDTPSAQFWSASAYVGPSSNSNAWAIDFTLGEVDFARTTLAHRVRCVR